MKVTVVGAGAVGASCAEYIAIKDFASEVVLLDIKEGYAEGKAMDLMQTASLNGFDTKLTWFHKRLFQNRRKSDLRDHFGDS